MTARCCSGSLPGGREIDADEWVAADAWSDRMLNIE